VPSLLRQPFSLSSSYRSYEPRPGPPRRQSSRLFAPPTSADFPRVIDSRESEFREGRIT